MTREDKKAVAVLKNDLNKLLRPLLKPYGFKRIGGFVWKLEGELLFTMIPLIKTPVGDSKAVLGVNYGVKPLFVDDLLWDILSMEENKQKPTSLRVNGAFTVQAVPLEKLRYTLDTLEVEELKTHLNAALEHFSQLISAVGSDGLSWFRQMEAEKDRYWQSEVMRLMLLIHDGKRDEAFEYIGQHQLTHFIVNGKSLSEMVAEYWLREKETTY